MNTILTKEGYLIEKRTCNEELLTSIRDDLTVEPYLPFNYGANDLDISTFCVYRETYKYLSVPKFYGIEKLGQPKLNKEIEGETVDFEFKGDLRPEQKEITKIIIPKLTKDDGGVLCLGCGQGKTVLGIYIGFHFKVKVLVIVHKSFLLNQWKERINQFTNARVGIIQQNKIETDGCQIVIGMLQSIAKDKYDPEIFKDFGLVIFDEAHHAPSQYFSQALPLINCKKTLALSATPKRSDRLEKVLHWYFGPTIYENKTNDKTNVIVKIFMYKIEHEKFIEKMQRFTGQVNRAGTISNIVTIGRRNKFIIDMLEDILTDKHRKILILSERIEHLNLLKTRLDSRNITTSGLYVGGMKQAHLDESAKKTVIFGTFHMASEALDIKGLNTLIMATGRREIEQTIGRITRDPNSSIVPMVVDIVDDLPSFVSQGNYRRNYYKKNGYEVFVSDVINNIVSEEKKISFTKCFTPYNNNNYNNDNNDNSYNKPKPIDASEFMD